jgi:hypothetical protein
MRREVVALSKRLPKEIKRVTGRAGLIVTREIQKQIRGSRTRAKLNDEEPFMSKRVRKVGKNGKVRQVYKKSGALPESQLGIHTGQLRKSIGSRTRGGIYRFGRTKRAGRLIYYVELGTKLIYAAVHEYGQPRRIRAKRAPFLVFRISKRRWIKATSVKTVQRPFFRKGIRKGIPKAQREIGRIVRVIR